MLRTVIAAAVLAAGLIACDIPTIGKKISPPPTLHFDIPSPYWNVSTWPTITTSTGSVRLRGYARDSTGVAAVAYRLADGASVPMSLEVGQYSASFDAVIDVPDGIYPLFVTAVDREGNRSDPMEFTVRATSATLEVHPLLVTIESRAGEAEQIESLRLTGTAEGIERLRYELIFSVESYPPYPGTVVYSSPIELAADGSFETEVEIGVPRWNRISVVGEDALGVPITIGGGIYQLAGSAPDVEIRPVPAERVVDPETGQVELTLAIDGRPHLVTSLEVQVDEGGWEPIGIPENRISLEIPWSPALTRDTSDLAVRAVSTGGGTRIVRFQIPAS